MSSPRMKARLYLQKIWSEKRKMCFPIKRQDEGVYYLADFNIAASAITKLKDTYKLIEDILRVMIIRI